MFTVALFGSLLPITSVPFLLPAVVGVKLTVIVPVAPGCITSGVCVATLKPGPPFIVSVLISSGAAPVFVIVTVRDCVWFIATVPKSTADVTTLILDARPFPVTLITWLPPLVLDISIDPVAGPGWLGLNVTVAVVVAPGATES